jgi:hypothetical protein
MRRLVGGAARVHALFADAAKAPGHPTPPSACPENALGRETVVAAHSRTTHAPPSTAGATSVMAELGFPVPAETANHQQALRWLTDLLEVVLAAEFPDAEGCRCASLGLPPCRKPCWWGQCSVCTVSRNSELSAERRAPLLVHADPCPNPNPGPGRGVGSK